MRYASEGFTREHFEGVDANDDHYLWFKFIENNPLFEPVTFFSFDNNKWLHEGQIQSYASNSRRDVLVYAGSAFLI